MWRGAFTGPPKSVAKRNHISREWIVDLFHRTSGDGAIDVGFTGIPGDKKTHPMYEDVRKCAAPRMSLEDQLQNKYILSIEGNDVSTGLKWMMLSNSVVVMPQPSIESWFCESFLEPFVHYVPVKADLSDTEEVIEWCRDNDKTCAEIAQNGKNFAVNFTDPEKEIQLFEQVVKWYCTDRRIRDAVEHSIDILLTVYRDMDR